MSFVGDPNLKVRFLPSPRLHNPMALCFFGCTEHDCQTGHTERLVQMVNQFAGMRQAVISVKTRSHFYSRTGTKFVVQDAFTNEITSMQFFA